MTVEAKPDFNDRIVSLETLTLDENGRPIHASQRMLFSLLMEDVIRQRIPGVFQTRPENNGAHLSLEIVTKTEAQRIKATQLKEVYLTAIARWDHKGFPGYGTLTTREFRKKYVKTPRRRRTTSA